MDASIGLRRIAAQGVDVPGTPYSLRLDGVGAIVGERRRIDWSFRDPTGEVGRVAGSTEVPGAAAPEDAWRAAQLDAAVTYTRHLDLDTRPGEPYVPLQFADEPAGDPDDDPDGWVPCAVPVVDGLPLWASDDLDETVLAGGRFVVTADGIVTDP